MAHDPRPEPPHDVVQLVDTALELLWRGDGRLLDELVEQPGSSGPSVNEMLEGVTALGDAPPVELFEQIPVGSYALTREIGRGGMGVVYEAAEIETGRAVAIKVMLAGPFASESSRRRFEREERLAARLTHPGIARILDRGQLSSGQPYYAMEYVDGVTLDRYLADTRPETRAILELFAAICDAVHCAHEHDVAHRDLKPGNVLIDRAGHPHVLDFGLAKAIDHADAGTRSMAVSTPGEVLGTLRYMSPEQATGRPLETDARTDVHALGVMLFEALTGSLPYDLSGRSSEILERIAEQPPVLPSSRSRTVDRKLEAIVLKTLEKEKARRYPSAGALRDDIRRYLGGEPPRARGPGPIHLALDRLRRHRRPVAAAAAALAVIALVASSAVAWRGAALSRQRDLARARVKAVDIQRSLEIGRTEAALGPARALAGQHPQLTETGLVWAQAQFRMGRERGDNDLILAAINQLRNHLRRGPVRWAHSALLRDFYLHTGGDPPAEVLAAAAYGAPATAEASYLSTFATLDRDTAVTFAERAVHLDPGHLPAWQRLAHLSLLRGDHDRAADAARALIDAGVDGRRWTLLLIEVRARQGRYADAANLCGDLIALDPRWARSYRYRAVVRLCNEDHVGAVEDFTRAADLTGSNDAWALYGRATPLWILGRTDEAAADYRAFRKRMGHATFADARLFLVLRDQASRLEDPEDAIEARRLRDEARRGLEVGRRGAAPGSWLGRVLATLAGDLAPEELVESADPRDPEQLCEAYFYAGEAYRLDGRTTRAGQSYARCVQTGLWLDLDSATLDPMNECHLARWRLRSLTLSR